VIPWLPYPVLSELLNSKRDLLGRRQEHMGCRVESFSPAMANCGQELLVPPTAGAMATPVEQPPLRSTGRGKESQSA